MDDTPLMPPPPPPPPVSPRRRLIGRRTAAAAVAGGLVVGGVAGGYVISQAASPSPSATASPSAGSSTTPGDADHGNPGGPAARDEDVSQAAAAIGITSAQLQTELTAGKTIAAVAKEHNVDVAKVVSTLVGDENTEIDAQVSAGRLTAAQATQMKAQTNQRVTDLVNGTRPAGGPGGPGHGGGGSAEDQQVIADALKLSTAQVAAERTAGKTVATIAKEHNIDPATVVAALAASENMEIDAQVTAGKLTAAQAAQMKSGATQRATDEVNGTEPAHGGHGDGGPPDGTGAPPTS